MSEKQQPTPSTQSGDSSPSSPTRLSSDEKYKSSAASQITLDAAIPSIPQDLEKTAGEVNADPEYSEWTTWERRFIIFCAAAAAFFSPLSSNIYFPLFGTLSEVLGVSITLINLTVTTYMIFQGITPMFIAAISDGLGRRPAYIVCFTVYLAANIGLALQTDYAALACLRALQSAGSASTVALGKAVVADVAVAEQRGRYSSITSVGIFLGPAFGPIIGGLLAYYLGWRSVFWFLVISSGVVFMMLLVAFPETCRKIVGNGSEKPASWNISLVSWLHLRRKNGGMSQAPENSTPKPKLKMPNFWVTVKIACQKEMAIVTVTSGMCFSAFYAVTSAVPSLFADIYGYNTIQIGLCFISVGAGSFVAALVQGNLIDWNYKRHALRTGFPLTKKKSQDLTRFPLEVARLELAIPILVLLAASTLLFGWLVHFETSVAGPLVALFFSGFSSSSSYSIITVLIIDVHPDKPAAATAGNNLVRCLLSAAATGAIIPMCDAMGRGWAFTLVAALCAACIPLLYLCMKKGQKWRAEMNGVTL